jgi:hypothetical protein
MSLLWFVLGLLALVVGAEALARRCVVERPPADCDAGVRRLMPGTAKFRSVADAAKKSGPLQRRRHRRFQRLEIARDICFDAAIRLGWINGAPSWCLSEGGFVDKGLKLLCSESFCVRQYLFRQFCHGWPN